ncbi:hypothetical protein A1D17_28585 [Pseudomonas fluorescens]|uniref:Uncharacterized protein n=1 Tax=Pseudomonas fluorescens TaxID=294 RepID=A0A166Q999_PSEFL|nr:hypothetical protein A1D17_28585 [Pseudomonas fluorescens]
MTPLRKDQNHQVALFITFAILGQSFDFLQLAIALDPHHHADRTTLAGFAHPLLHLVRVDPLLH